MKLVICENNDDIRKQIINETPVIIIKHFEKEEVCNTVIKSAHVFTKKNKPKIGNRFKETFWQFDVLPTKVLTERIFRTLCIHSSDKLPIVELTRMIFEKMALFQDKFLSIEESLNDKIQRKPQIIHYPIGGGFFDWHTHPRFPTNYGLILNLSKKGRDFNEGQTEIKVNRKAIIKVDKYADIGDLILFRYDLPHRVAPCDPREDLIFSSKGRWTAILPLLDASRQEVS